MSSAGSGARGSKSLHLYLPLPSMGEFKRPPSRKPTAAESWTIYLDYIAYLADEGEIDDAYLVPFVKCQIVTWDMNALEAQRAPVPASAARLVRFGPHAVSYVAKHRDHLDCP